MTGKPSFHLDLFREILKLRIGIAQADNRRAFELLSSIYPLELQTFASGEEHNGWVIPDDWVVERALIRQDGRTLFDGTAHPLAVVQNSASMRGTFSKAELDQHIFTRPAVPDAYAFHFLNTYRPWNRTWGFCVPHRIWQTWGPGEYEVELATTSRPGTMIVGAAHLAGHSDETIVFNAHTCHPCQFNDDLAGVAAILELFRWLKERPRRFSYRAVLGPEHFGTVFYLNRMSRAERERLEMGLFVEMVGIDAPLVLQRSFSGTALIDRVATHVLRDNDPKLKTGDFRTIVGNDETVWEAPGIEIPFASLSRCFHPGFYAEYHTSGDDLERNRIDKLEETLEMLKRMVEVFEEDCTIERNFEGLIALSNPKYSLYIERPDPTVAKKFSDEDRMLGRIQDVLPRYLDGSRTVFEIAERLQVPFGALRRYLGQICGQGPDPIDASGFSFKLGSRPTLLRNKLAQTEKSQSGNRAAEAGRLQAAAGEPTLRAAILGSANVRVLRATYASLAAEFLSDRTVDTFEVPYGQLRQELLGAPKSSLCGWRPNLAIFCDRLEDLVGQARLDGISESQIQAVVREYADLIVAFHVANDGWAIVHRFAAVSGAADSRGAHPTFAIVEEMNCILSERLNILSQVLWVDVAAEAASARGAACDPMLWHLARLPFSEEFSQQLARRWIGLTLAILGKMARVVVLDLDNTLWGGVLGEDGLSGIRIGGDYPGNAYATFQRALKTLPARGIALAVCSRNDRDLATHALETHSEMVIRPADLVAMRIDWRAKWEGLREIAAELNLGLESLLFVDDNPIEREQVRLNLPEVKILDLPASPALFAEALADCPWLESAGLTVEDAGRIQSYQTLSKVREERRTAASLDEFYAGLGMQLHLQPLDDSNIARAVQLSQKTNQFNTTTRRYDQRSLRQIVSEGGDVVVIGLEDRHLQFENIGLIILRSDGANAGRGLVDCYLLSCRVLGRGLETAMLKWAVRRAANRRWATLAGTIVETPRNTPVRSVYAEAGFQAAAAPGEWMIGTDSVPEIPTWLKIHDRMPSA